REGRRELPGGMSLAQLLQQERGVRNLKALPPLSVAQILAWADEHYARTGQWPKGDSGTVPGTQGETWGGIGQALSEGRRGLPGGDTLPQLLQAQRGVRNHLEL